MGEIKQGAVLYLPIAANVSDQRGGESLRIACLFLLHFLFL